MEAQQLVAAHPASCAVGGVGSDGASSELDEPWWSWRFNSATAAVRCSTVDSLLRVR